MKKLGLALGSGGALGFAHIGVIKSLRENNVKIDAIAGSSAGAIVGAYYSLYNRVDSLEKMAMEFVKESPFKLFEISSLTSRDKRAMRIKLFLEEEFRNNKFSDCKIPFAAVATDLETGEEVIIKRGRLLTAISASMSVPGVFGPEFYWGRWLVDGGVVNPTPISVAKDMSTDFVLGVDLTEKIKKPLNGPPGIFSTIFRSIDIMISDVSRFRSAEVKEKMILYPNFKKTTGDFKEKAVKEYIKVGYESMNTRIDELKSNLKEK